MSYKTSKQISCLVNNMWFSRYPRPRYVTYDNGSEFKLHFKDLCDTYGLKCKSTILINPHANAILECTHQVIVNMLCPSKLDMTHTLAEEDISDFLANAPCAICSTHHTVLKTSPGSAIFSRDVLFDIPYLVDWKKNGVYSQQQTDRNMMRKNILRCNHDYIVGAQVLIYKDGVLCKSESRYTGSYTIMQVHTNSTIRVQCG